ncbi:MAG TPA: S8 family serine peptidase, partial [Verrucomicrobiae bacterium]|nr:S8 family serine peptidase [Verrucomicrobiae bacterium]
MPVIIAIGMVLAFGKIDSLAVTLSEKISDTALQEIQTLELEKTSRSPVHRKLDSQIVLQLKQNRQQLRAMGVTNLQPQIKFAGDGRVLVDINAEVTDDLLTRIKEAGGEIVASIPRLHSIRALLPLEQLESLAGSAQVKFIKRAVKAMAFSGSIDSAGDTTHGADIARATFGATGVGVKIGVLSDSVDHLATSQASGDLPTNVVVLAGQAGSGQGEGTAMMEVIHDLAPDAQLYFATAFTSEASFAQNILNLRSNGCDIIVDDVLYFDESPFQDGPVAQAVNSVTSDGALYFSSAGNNGNLNDTTSTTWEGDFVDGGVIDTNTTIGQIGEIGSRIHDFGGLNYNRALAGFNANATIPLALFWSDPLGGSSNDYDLFVLDPNGTHVLFASGDFQDGSQDPYEACDCGANDRIVVVKFAGDARFLHLQLIANGSARLNISTSGSILGHDATTNAFCVAAINTTVAFPNPFGATNPNGPFPGLFSIDDDNFVEWFSSDGPRHVFFNSDGTPITPGDFSSTGGAFRQKPDLTAADGVSNTVPGVFQPRFYGTSCAAPHAAAIAALVKSYNHSLTQDQIRTALTSTALDIEDPGADRDSGAGIVMAMPALQYVQNLLATVIESFSFTNNCAALSWNCL